MSQEDLKKKIVDLLLPRIHPYLIVLFGSTTQKRERKESDIDIGFLSDTSFSSYETFMIAQELANSLDRDIDLINLATASTVLQAQIINTGEVLYCEDEKRWMEFKIKVLKMYAKLNEERKVVLESIKKSGMVYGE
jgi:uncharacterized protein